MVGVSMGSYSPQQVPAPRVTGRVDRMIDVDIIRYNLELELPLRRERTGQTGQAERIERGCRYTPGPLPPPPMEPMNMRVDAYCRMAEEAFITHAKAYIANTEEETPVNPQYGEAALSDKLVEYAHTYSGDDRVAAVRIREALEWGFEDATRQLGRRLPDITYMLLNMVRARLDVWMAGLED